MPTQDQLFRLSAVAAIAAGLLRIASSFPISQDPVTLEWLYTGIDILFLFGLIGIYLARASRLGFLGLASFGVAVAALSFIGGPDADPFGFSTYQEGATTLAIAMVGLSIAWLRVGERPLIAPFCWIGSILAASAPMGLDAPWPAYGMTAAGILFGAGFISAGYALLTGNRPAAGAAAR